MSQVSILTITNNIDCLENLYHIIQRQRYVHIKEWIIVEGSQHLDLHLENIQRLHQFISEKESHTDIEIRGIHYEDLLPLSSLRNLGNDTCRGDVIIYMNDNEHYPPTYIPSIVRLLIENHRYTESEP